MSSGQSSEVLKSGIRGHICTNCYQRPRGSESLPANQPRACEVRCAIFRYLETLERIDATDALIDTPGECEHALIEGVCRTCTLSSTAGDYCLDRLTRSCPLSRYIPTVMELIEQLTTIRVRPAA